MKATYVLEMLETNQIERLKEIVRNEARKEVEKSLGNAKLLSVVKKMLKNGQERTNGYIKYNEKYYFTDGFRLLESDTDLGFTEIKNGFKIESVTRNFEGIKFEVDIIELKNIIAENKIIDKKNKQIKKDYKGTPSDQRPYLAKKLFIINNEIAFDSVKMLEMIEATGTNIIHYESPLQACYFGDNFRNILLPMRMK